MKVTVLGAYGPYPPAGGCCSGYLVEDKNFSLLIDCGNGVLSRLSEFIDPSCLDAVILSHLHFDHFSDIFILRYALKHDKTSLLPLFLPEEPVELVKLIKDDVYQHHTIFQDNIIELGPFQISFQKNQHPVLCYAIKVASKDKTLVFSSDSEFYKELTYFSQGADLFFCEASFLQTRGTKENHMSAYEAASIACLAKVKKLALTHLSPYEKKHYYLAEAKKIFPETELALEQKTYFL